MFEGLFFGFVPSLDLANPTGNVGVARFLSIALVDDVLGHFAAVHGDVTREFQSHADSIPFNACDANNPDRIFWITNHNFFGFASCDDKHGGSPPADQHRSSARDQKISDGVKKVQIESESRSTGKAVLNGMPVLGGILKQRF
jgi:hypothetical protein